MADRIYNGHTEVQDPFEQITGLLLQSLITVEENCHSLQDHVYRQRRSIAESLRKLDNDAKKSRDLATALNLYDEINAHVSNLEESCYKYRIKIPEDIASEIFQRLHLPFLDRLPSFERTHQALDRTENIIYGPKRSMPSEFDDSDEKFMQDIMILRTKMFSMSMINNDADASRVVDENEGATAKRGSSATAAEREFIERPKQSGDSYVLPPLPVQLANVGDLKFVDGEMKASDSWTRLLDTHGQQARSKWYLVVCPQIEALAAKYKITLLHLSPKKTFDFIVNIPDNGSTCRITRKDVIPLVSKASEIRWLLDSKLQLRMINGRDFAATLMQSCWRGFWVRKCLFEAKCKYIAASIIWVAWIVVKKKRQMHERYLANMLTSHDITRELNRKFSDEYESITYNHPHTIINIPSVGFPLDVRRTFDVFGRGYFGVYQNSMGLKLSLIKNRKARVIFVLAVNASDDLIEMYNETIESVLPNEDAQRRVAFLELSQARSFADRSFNVSRCLHASVDTLAQIRNTLKDHDTAPAFFLPWIMDECDVRLAGNFRLPLLAPDLDVQRSILDKSRMSATIDKLGLEQPPYSHDITDYRTLCLELAEKICSNTDICVWLLKLNVGFTDLHTGVFLINHMSIPFMPILRKEREIHGDDWNENCQTRANFCKSLSDHLPRIVSTLTRFTGCYKTWRDFYGHMTKYGCLLQGVPNDKSAKYISVTLFVPGGSTGRSPQWTGTAETIYFARDSRFFTVGHTMPQTTLDNALLAPTIQRLSHSLQNDGYFGHLCIDLCCYRRKQDDKLVTLVVETNPCYQQIQHYVDWIKFAIDGSYDQILNKFYASDAGGDTAGIAPAYLPTSNGNVLASPERYAIVIDQLYHTQFSHYSWNKLATMSKECGIRWNSSTKEGAHLLLHDGTLKTFAMLVSIASSMESAIILVKNCVKKLYKALESRATADVVMDNNFSQVMHCLEETLEKYRAMSLDKCDPLLDRVR